MSGGVDSSVACLLLKQQGFDVVGLHMKSENKETQEADALRVKELCEKMQIKCEFVDYQDEMQIVKDYFVNTYLEGKTPNPCVVCNREVKFKPFIEYAEKIENNDDLIKVIKTYKTAYCFGEYTQKHLVKLKQACFAQDNSKLF